MSNRYVTDEVVCAERGCAASVPDHYWGLVKAEGWFFQRDGSAWCPQHIPPWVAGWRARKTTTRKEQP